MTLDFSERKFIKIKMEDYIESIWFHAHEDLKGGAFKTPAAAHLFQIDENGVKLTDDLAEIFHRVVAQLLFLTQRARPDIGTAVSFLMTRVREPDTDDWKKLRRCLSYLHSTKELFLRLGCNGEGIARWYIDAAYGVHPTMHSHTGGTLTLGNGSIISSSRKQKLVTRSSTEAELVAVHDILPGVIWTRNFLKAQGYNITENMIMQDNKSTILLETNGRWSAGRNSRDVKIEYCPTEDMWADFHSKPQQGGLFKRMRSYIMGHVNPLMQESIPTGVCCDNTKRDVTSGLDRTDLLAN